MADYVTQKELNDFALSMEAVVKDLRAENKALKKQLSALPQAEETLSKLMTATDQAQSMHGVMMTERKQAAEQSIQNREAIKAEIDSAFARLEQHQEAWNISDGDDCIKPMLKPMLRLKRSDHCKHRSNRWAAA